MYYIQRKDSNYLETVDEAKTLKEAKYLRNEYSIADNAGYYYISQRACKGWNK